MKPAAPSRDKRLVAPRQIKIPLVSTLQNHRDLFHPTWTSDLGNASPPPAALGEPAQTAVLMEISPVPPHFIHIMTEARSVLIPKDHPGKENASAASFLMLSYEWRVGGLGRTVWLKGQTLQGGWEGRSGQMNTIKTQNSKTDRGSSCRDSQRKIFFLTKKKKMSLKMPFWFQNQLLFSWREGKT